MWPRGQGLANPKLGSPWRGVVSPACEGPGPASQLVRIVGPRFEGPQDGGLPQALAFLRMGQEPVDGGRKVRGIDLVERKTATAPG